MGGLRIFVIAALLAGAARGDTLEAAAQALVDGGLHDWERGDLPAARAGFAHARDVLPDKPNPYRLLALIDAKLGHCSAAVLEADRFLALTTPDDRRRAEIVALRDSCAPPAPRSASPPPVPAAVATRPAVPPRGRGMKIAAVTVLAGGLVLAAAGGALIGTHKSFGGGVGLSAVGVIGVVLSVPLFVVAYR